MKDEVKPPPAAKKAPAKAKREPAPKPYNLALEKVDQGEIRPEEIVRTAGGVPMGLSTALRREAAQAAHKKSKR